MVKSIPGLPKQVQHLADYVVVFGIEVESGLTQSWSLQSCGAANTIVCMRNVDSLPTARQKTEPLPYKLPKKTFKDEVAGQDSRHRSPEKGRDAECTYSSEFGTVKMDRPCYKDAWGTFAKENPLWRTRNGQTLP